MSIPEDGSATGGVDAVGATQHQARPADFRRRFDVVHGESSSIASPVQS